MLLAALLATAFVPTLAWSTFNFVRFDTLGLSTMTGFDLTNKTGRYIKDAPSQYATIRDIYVAALRTRAGGDPVDLIWQLIPHMEAATGESYPELSQTFLKMNAGLILHHQREYSADAATVFAEFWKVGDFDVSPPPAGVTHAVYLLTKWLAGW